MEILGLKCIVTEIKNSINESNQKIRAALRIRKLEVRSLDRRKTRTKQKIRMEYCEKGYHACNWNPISKERELSSSNS